MKKFRKIWEAIMVFFGLGIRTVKFGQVKDNFEFYESGRWCLKLPVCGEGYGSRMNFIERDNERHYGFYQDTIEVQAKKEAIK